MTEKENFRVCCEKGYSILSGSQKVKERPGFRSAPDEQVLYGGKKQVSKNGEG
jgi:hypothetical protein